MRSNTIKAADYLSRMDTEPCDSEAVPGDREPVAERSNWLTSLFPHRCAECGAEGAQVCTCAPF